MKALAAREPSQPARPAAATAGMSATPMSAIYRSLSMSTPGTGQAEGADEQCASRSQGLARTTSLPVSHPDDPHELEADRVADAVMRSPSHSCNGCSAEAPCTACAEQHEVHRVASGPGPAIAAASPVPSGGGQPIDHRTRAQLEPRFGADLGAVRIHTDATAAHAADALAANAFTVGSDISFAVGRYAPDTASGRRLLAHELAHTLQQRSGTLPARGAVVSQPQPMLQRDTGIDAPPAPTAAPAIEPANRNKRIATWTGWIDTSVMTRMAVGEVPIERRTGLVGEILVSITPAGWTPGHYLTETAAVAAVRAAGTSGAVFVENGQFVAYHAAGMTPLHDFTFDNVRWFTDKPWTAVRFDSDPPPNVIVTEDGGVLRPEHFKSKDEARATMADQALMPGAGGDPFAGYKQAFSDLNRSALLEVVFYPAMRDHALSILAVGRVQIERDIERRLSSGMIPRGEIDLMGQTAVYLAGLDEEIDQVPKTIPSDPGDLQFEHDLLRFNELHARRKVVLARYPVLARVDARKFVALPEDQQMAQLGGESVKIRDDIDKTRNNIIDGTLNLWKIDSLVNATIAGLEITDPQVRTRMHDLAAGNQSTVSDDILTVFTIVFGLASAFVTGPLGVAAAAGALGLGVVDAIKQTQEITAERSAANTALDPSMSLLPPEDARDWGWLVVAWMGVIFDGAQVVTAVKAVRAANGTIEAGIEALAKGDQRIARELRLAAGAGDATEVISEANRAGLANRLGTPLEIDASLGPWEAQVYYHVDSEGRAVLDGIRCGKQATVGLILAHEPIVKMLRRYDGLLGRLRELSDKLRSLAGFPHPNAPPPFPAGSQAYESYWEIKKLPEIIESRRAALGTVLGTDSEAVLRRDVEFLENELLRHQQVVDQMVLERGVGFIAAAGEGTKKAIDAGMPNFFKSPLVKDPRKYYYRVNPAGNPPYILTRFTESDAPALTLVPDGGGWRIAEGALSRSAEGVEIVAGWPLEIREGFAAVKLAFTGSRVVPLKGVAPTGWKIGELMTATQKDGLTNILVDAFTATNDPNPLARATPLVKDLLEHKITVVKGTDQLRAYNYRLDFEKATGAKASADLHHLIPLYLGGDHTRLVDMVRGLHDELHDLIDGVRLPEGVALAPGSIQNVKSLTFDKGAAVLYNNGRVQLVRLNPDGTFEPVP
jgi:Domain of unknown function (DUF4157)